MAKCKKGTNWNPSRSECDREDPRRASLGKFEGGYHIDGYIWDLSGDGFVNEEAGDEQENGKWFGLMKGALLKDIQKKAKENKDRLTKGEREYLANSKGAIVSEDDQGFVGVTVYKDETEMKKDWKEIEDEIAEFYKDSEEE